MRMYPDDYPESVAFPKYNKSRAMQLIDRHRRLPKQKRCSYGKIRSPYPFYMNVPSRGGVVGVRVSMLSKGKCVTGSYICRLEG